jgi:two-component system OmpR family response regulator
MRVLLAEDDPQLAELIRQALVSAAFLVDIESDGQVVFERGQSEDFDAVLLDLGLPALDGVTILKRWRQAGRTMPILILTARTQWEERVEAIEAGADDYLVKPFRLEEVLARLRAILRRTHGLPTAIAFSGLTLDPRLTRVVREGVPIEVTPHEYKLLSYLVFNRGRVVSQVELTQHIYRHDAGRRPNSIEVLVGRLRKRLGDNVIRTRRGFGYYIEEE